MAATTASPAALPAISAAQGLNYEGRPPSAWEMSFVVSTRTSSVASFSRVEAIVPLDGQRALVGDGELPGGHRPLRALQHRRIHGRLLDHFGAADGAVAADGPAQQHGARGDLRGRHVLF